MKLPEYINCRHSIKNISASTLCIIAILSFTLTACGKKAEEAPKEVIRPVKTLTVTDIGDLGGLTFPGTVRASQRVELAFKEIGGRLIELPIEGREGQEVTQGELLARIDPQDFETNLRNVQGRLKETQAALQLAKSEFARVKRIQKQDPGAVSGADIDRKREAVNATEGRIRSLKAEVEDAKNRLSYTYLKAPFTGLIANRYVNNFQNIKPKQPVLRLEDISKIEILVGVPENVVAGIRSVEQVKAAAEFPTAPGRQFSLSLKEYSSRADPATQTYQVVWQMPQPENLNALPGMTATVTLTTGGGSTQETLVRIPAIAVLAEPNGKSFVWVVNTEELTVRKQEVKVGSISGSENIDILEGLKSGETIAVAGILKLKDGMRVRLWEQQSK
jgi:RND family efflux transporter MFP subunit